VHACVVQSLSCVWPFVVSWTAAHKAPLSMGFSRQEYWNGLPFPPPGELPDPGIEPVPLGSPALQVDSLPVAPLGKYWVETRDTAKHPIMHRPPPPPAPPNHLQQRDIQLKVLLMQMLKNPGATLFKCSYPDCLNANSASVTYCCGSWASCLTFYCLCFPSFTIEMMRAWQPTPVFLPGESHRQR